MTGTSTVTIRFFLTTPDEQIRVMGTLGREDLVDDIAVVAQREGVAASDVAEEKDLAAVTVRPPARRRFFAVLIEEARTDAAKAVEIAAAQRIGQRKKPGARRFMRCIFGIEHEADAAHGFRAPACVASFLVLHVIMENDAGREK